MNASTINVRLLSDIVEMPEICATLTCPRCGKTETRDCDANYTIEDIYDGFYSEGYCYAGVYSPRPLSEFPWTVVIIFGAILLLVLLMEVIHKTHKKGEQVTLQSLEDGLRKL